MIFNSYDRGLSFEFQNVQTISYRYADQLSDKVFLHVVLLLSGVLLHKLDVFFSVYLKWLLPWYDSVSKPSVMLKNHVINIE